MADQSSGRFAKLVESLIVTMTTSIEKSSPDRETYESMRPVSRPAVTAEQIDILESKWGRPIPPSYRSFLEVSNGIKNFQGTFLLLGTEDHLEPWADEQVAWISQYWGEDGVFNIDQMIPLVVPEAESGIRHFWAFKKGRARELQVVDWDNGAIKETYRTFGAFLRRMRELELKLKKPPNDSPKRLKRSDPRRLILSGRPFPKSSRARARRFDAVFELEDVGEIETMVEQLAAASPTDTELYEYAQRLDRGLSDRTLQAFVRAELIFRLERDKSNSLYKLWLRRMNAAIHHAFGANDLDRAVRWSEIARPYVKDFPILGHNLACVYVAVQRTDDAFETCKIALANEYPQASDMRRDKDLGPLLKQARFTALFTSPRQIHDSSRLVIPRNPRLEADMAAGNPADYGAWLKGLDRRLGSLVLTDKAAEEEPKSQRKTKSDARRQFESYVEDVLGPAFPKLRPHFKHFLDGRSHFEFRYGFLDDLDTFPLRSVEERNEVWGLLADPHAMFVRRIRLRKICLESFDMFANLHALRQLNCSATDITQVDSLDPLSALKHLKAINISNSGITDLSPLRDLPIIQLYAGKSDVVDLSPLAGHPTLSLVELNETHVTDIRPLMSIPNLCRVELWDTAVPMHQLEELNAYLEETANAPVVCERALIHGYDRGLSHPDI